MSQPGKLYMVGTPIGNLGDLTKRAQEVLTSVDWLACEDTRRTAKLMAHLQLEKPLRRADAASERRMACTIAQALRSGQNVAFVSDAGMPGVSDPGQHLVRALRAEGLETEVVPGVSALTAAIALCPFKRVQPFTFYGFLAKKGKERTFFFDSVEAGLTTSIFFESPHRIGKTLKSLADAFPDRQLTVCRELTKLHEQTCVGSCLDLHQSFLKGDLPEKGEYTVILGNAKEVPT